MEDVFETIAQAVKPTTATPQLSPGMQLALDMIRATTGYQVGHYNVDIINANAISIYPTHENGSTLHGIDEIGGMLRVANIHTYVGYDEDRKKCYMRIFKTT
jgi:hypothetical protein